MRFDLGLQVAQFFKGFQTRVKALQTRTRKSIQTKTGWSWSATTQFFVGLQTKVRSIQSMLTLSLQNLFRTLRLQLSTFTKLNPQSLLLRLFALAAAALMTVLIIVGIQTVARETWSSAVPNERAQSQTAASPNSRTWAGLPTASSESSTKLAQKPVQAPKTTPQASPATKPAQPQANQSNVPAKPASPQPAPEPTSPVPSAILHSSLSAIAPRQEAALAHPTNYGERYAKDIFGKPVDHDPIVVLHETVGTADSAINTVRTPHYNEDDQSSYHSIIRLDGTIVYVVPPEKRAFGAGNSVFKSSKGLETVKTHKAFPPSVNNFAYHISLETPADGHNNAPAHSGYTDDQYRSLAWLVAHTSVTDDRVTTHRAIDQSGSRLDPRSFDATKFYTYLRALPRPGLAQSSG